MAKFSRKFFKIRIKNLNKRQAELEKVLNEYEICGNTNSISKELYDISKVELEKIIENASRGAMLPSKAEYIEKGEKPTKFVLNLEKSRGANTINKLKKQSPHHNVEINTQDKILAHIKDFYVNIL